MLILCTELSTISKDAQALQADLNKLVLWAQKWQMTFNSSKCVLLRISRSLNDVDFTYEIITIIIIIYNLYRGKGRPLESVESHKYLGVEIDRKLSWNKHISAITGKGNRALGFIRRNLHNCHTLNMQALRGTPTHRRI